MKSSDPTAVFNQITLSNEYRAPVNFFVVAYDENLKCIADGQDPSNVGLGFDEVIRKNKVITSFNLGQQFNQIAAFALGKTT